MLETGIYPPMQIINKMKKKGFDYYLYDQSIISSEAAIVLWEY